MTSLVADAGLCVLYIGLNSALNVANRYALGVHDFAFPLTLTATHMLLNPVFLSPMMLLHSAYKNEHRKVLSSNWFGLMIIAALNSVQIALNNSSLVHIEISVNQVVRATMPIFVALLQFLRSSEPPSLSQLPVLGAISLGVILVVYQPALVSDQLFGVFLVSSSVGLQAGQMSFAGSLLSAKLDSFQMTFYTSPLAFLTLIGPALFLEGSAFLAYAKAKPGITATVLVGTCAMAVLYNVVLFQTIRRLNAVGSSVLGNVKVVLLLLLAKIFMGEMHAWEARHYTGCALTFGGAMAYSLLKLRGGEAAKTKKG